MLEPTRIRRMVTLTLVVVVVVVGQHVATAANYVSLTHRYKPTTEAGSSQQPAANPDIFAKCMSDDELEQQQEEYRQKGWLVTGNIPASFQRKQNRVQPAYSAVARAVACLRMNIVKNGVDASQGIPLDGTPAAANCLPKVECDKSAKYRTSDGTCNNLQEPLYTQSLVNFDRFVPPTYDNLATSSPRGKSVEDGSPLPSARVVSSTIVSAADELVKHTTLFTHFGQFLDHDITQTPNTNINNIACCAVPSTPNCFPVEIKDPNDYFVRTCNKTCLEFVRSAEGVTDREGVCSIGTRQQFSAITPVIDASQVYGSDPATAADLRTNQTGKLKTSECTGHSQSYLPVASGSCQAQNLTFQAGDSRVNEIPFLTVMQTVFLREHNVICDRLAELNPDWDDERLYQESRRIVGAEMQHMVYNEFLPILLGKTQMEKFNLTVRKTGYFTGYDATVPATMWSEFATAAFRYGHSLVTNSLDVAKRDPSKAGGNGYTLKKTPLADNYNKPNILTDTRTSFGEVATAMALQKCERLDRSLSHSLTHDLFKIGDAKCGSDLASLNIQRGRDHGLGTYTQLWNLFFPDDKIDSWEKLGEVFREGVEIDQLKAVYKSVNDVDLWLGILSEKPVPGGLVGPTGATIIGLQFGRAKFGDRFYFENGKGSSPYPFTKRQLCSIRRWGTIARIMRDHGGVKNVPCNPFVAGSDETEMKACPEKIPKLNLKAWGPKKD